MSKNPFETKLPDNDGGSPLPNNTAILASICALTLAIWLYLEIDATAYTAFVSALVIGLCYSYYATSKNMNSASTGLLCLIFVGGIFSGLTTPTFFSLLFHLLATLLIRFPLRATESIALSSLVSLLFCIGMVRWNRVYGRMPTREIEALRQEFAPISLKPRLQYEVAATTSKKAADERRDFRNVDELTTAVLDPQLVEFEIIESSEDPYEQSNRAHRYLRVLHSRQAHAFANREGFGVWRMNPVPNRYRVQPPALQTLPFGRQEDYLPKDYDWEYIPWANTVDGILWLMGQDETTSGSPSMDTQQETLAWVHSFGVVDFFQPRGLGLRLGPDQWAGFVPHAFHINPLEIDSGKQFILKQLQLVSMLKFDRPQVYELDHLPRMDQLSQDQVATRDLNPFESLALQRLQEGADIVTHTHNERVRMLGALRAKPICLECHTTKTGGILGAFTYELESPYSRDKDSLDQKSPRNKGEQKSPESRHFRGKSCRKVKIVD